MLASAGTLSTLECSTVRSGRSALIRLRKRVAPMAEDPMPASQAKTILPPSVSDMTAASAVPFISRSCSLAWSRTATSMERTSGTAMANETPAAMTTPTRLVTMQSEGDVERNAMIEPGEAAEVRPAPMRLYQAMAHMLPTVGAMMTLGS